MMEKNQYRVEVRQPLNTSMCAPGLRTRSSACVCGSLLQHLFTCDLDGKDLSNVRDCVERLKLLDQMGRVWGQNMMLEVQGANLLLSDIETKVYSMCASGCVHQHVCISMCASVMQRHESLT